MDVKKFLTKKNVSIFLIVTWILFSVGYVLNDQWQNYKLVQLQKVYQLGSSNFVKTLVNESKKCQPILLSDGVTEVNMISIECLEQNKK